ncbi:MAG TPA: LysR family transcriptional regulator [Solirubrobacteraceae bacterium]|nr:LysR family transcriptional regulator [Solirubrobacteraceae bacterium]
MLDLHRLQIFQAVAQRRSFSAAALELSYTQSSVSEAVATLERELGITLLERSSRPVGLTPAGEVVLAHAEALLGQADAVERDLDALTQGDAGRLRLAGFFTAWSTFLPDAIAEFAASRPGVRLELEQLDPPAALRRLRAGEIDLAVIYRFEPGDPADDHDSRLVSTHLAQDPYALAVPAKTRLARKARLKVADLAGASWCTAPPGSSATVLLQRFCREHGGFEPKLDYPTEDVAMAQPLIAAGLAVALLPSLNLARPHPGVSVRELPVVPPGRDVWCVRPASRRLPATQPMVDALARAASRF